MWRPGWTALVVALSGFCSLVYQVLWERTLRYNVGGDSVSAAIVTGTFLLGLGLGGVRAVARAGVPPLIDNLTVAHWVGATAVKSVQYFRQVHRILKPDGVLVYHGNWGGARHAILAGLTETYAHVVVQPGAGPAEEVVLASDRPPGLDPVHVAAVLQRLAATTGMLGPDGWPGGLARVTRADVPRARPVRDDLLIYEYHRDPVRAVRRWLRSLGR